MWDVTRLAQPPSGVCLLSSPYKAWPWPARQGPGAHPTGPPGPSAPLLLWGMSPGGVTTATMDFVSSG